MNFKNFKKMSTTFQLDPYTLLIIFYHIDDLKTLYGSCSRVCRDWYRTFFAESSDKKWNRNLQPLHNSSFCKIVDKIVYMNRMADVLDLSGQYSEWMGTAPYYNLYNQFECELHSSGEIIGKVLKHKKKVFSTKLFKKRYMTLGCYCPLVASIRNPHMAIRKLSQANSIPRMFQGSIASCCQFLVVVSDNHSKNSSISFYSSVDNECLLKEFKIGENVRISSMALTFHPLMSSEHRKMLNIDPKQPDVNIYCLYVLCAYTTGGFNLKKYLVCDNLKGELLVKEQCLMVTNSTHNCEGSLSVPGWEHVGMDLVVITTPDCLYLVSNHGIIHYIRTGHVATSPSITPYSGNSFHASYLINFTKALNTRGFSLEDTNTYSNYSVFSLQFGGNTNEYLDFIYIYLVIAQKKVPLNNEYSVFVNVSPNVSKSIKRGPSIYSMLDIRDYTERILNISNQG